MRAGNVAGLRALAALVLTAWSTSGTASTSSPAIETAVVPADAKVTRTEPPVGGAVIRLRAARGEREPALVIVRSAKDGLLQAHVSALFSHDGAVLPSSMVELDRVQWIAGAQGEVADRLEPVTAPITVTASENTLLWVEVAVPRSAAPGFYHGELQLSGAMAGRNLPIELEVLPFALPQTPSLATSFSLGASGPVGAFARTGLKERLTFRIAEPPPFRVLPLEGTLQLDFTAFDRDIAMLLDGGPVGPSSIEVAVPRSVPTPRRLEYLLAVKRHLAERGCGDLLVNFSEEGSLLRHVQGVNHDEVPGIALVSASDEPTSGRFWWRLGKAGRGQRVVPVAAGVDLLEDSGDWLRAGASVSRVRSIGWAAFESGALGLYTQEPLPLLYTAEDGSPRESVRLKLLREGLEDYEYLQLAARVDPAGAKRIAREASTEEGLPTTRPVDFDGARTELVRIISSRRPTRSIARVP